MRPSVTKLFPDLIQHSQTVRSAGLSFAPWVRRVSRVSVHVSTKKACSCRAGGCTEVGICALVTGALAIWGTDWVPVLANTGGAATSVRMLQNSTGSSLIRFQLHLLCRSFTDNSKLWGQMLQILFVSMETLILQLSTLWHHKYNHDHHIGSSSTKF